MADSDKIVYPPDFPEKFRDVPYGDLPPGLQKKLDRVSEGDSG